MQQYDANFVMKRTNVMAVSTPLLTAHQFD